VGTIGNQKALVSAHSWLDKNRCRTPVGLGGRTRVMRPETITDMVELGRIKDPDGTGSGW
jgi:hypothetical protein